MSASFVQAVCHRALAGLPSPPDGYCADAAIRILADFVAVGVLAHARAYAAPNHPGPHFTIVVGDTEYDPTIGYANWSRRLHVPRGRLYVVDERSPHRRWSVLEEIPAGMIV